MSYDDPFKTHRPLNQPPAPPNTYELGIAMAGAVSGGAYTAGVLDYLIEALDHWEALKQKQRNKYGDNKEQWEIPFHDVCLKAMTGASAGSICAAIAAKTLLYKYIPANQSDFKESKNQLFNVWVNELKLENLLTNDDIHGKGKNRRLQSLLDITHLNEVALRFIKNDGERQHRSYVSPLLRLVFSTNNLRGITYKKIFNGNIKPSNYYATDHQDYIRFSLNTTEEDSFIPLGLCPDEIPLTLKDDYTSASWKKFQQAALGSGAFPVAMAPQLIVRQKGSESGDPNDDYLHHRYQKLKLLTPSQSPEQAYQRLTPEISLPDNYPCYLSDGGALDNEPFGICHDLIAGLEGSNARDSDKANRGIIMIDPFPDISQGAQLHEKNNPGLLDFTLASLLTSWKNSARFNSSDIIMALDEKISSRFLVVPVRKNPVMVKPSKDENDKVERSPKPYHLASQAFGAFGGFLHRNYRQHDFMLGRYNCQKFLQEYFVLDKANDIFKLNGKYNLEFSKKWGNTDGKIPIIPDLNDAGDGYKKISPHDPEWPSDTKIEWGSLESKMAFRSDIVIKKLYADYNAGWLAKGSINFAAFLKKRQIIQKLLHKISDELIEAELVKKEYIAVGRIGRAWRWFKGLF